MGDSLTADIGDHGWAKLFSDLHGIRYKNLAVIAGNNKTQILKLQHYLLSNEYQPDDIFFWEINATHRPNILVNKKMTINGQTIEAVLKDKAPSKFTYLVDIENIFCTTTDYGVILCHPELKDERAAFDPYKLQHVDEFILQDVLTYINLLVKSGHAVIVALGWEDAIAENHKETFLQYLNKTGAYIVNEAMLDWCIDQGLPLNDDNHPNQTVSTLLWAKTHLSSVLNEIQQRTYNGT